MKKTAVTSLLILAIATLSSIGENSSFVTRHSSLRGSDEAAAQWRVLPVFGGGFVQNVVVAPSNPSRWYTYVDVGGPYRSDDGGRTWFNVQAAGWQRGWSVAFDPHSPGLVAGAGHDGIVISGDGGATWKPLEGGLAYPTGVRRAVILNRGRLFGLTRGSGVWTRGL